MNKRDLSISMTRANIIAILIALPVGIFQFIFYLSTHGVKITEPVWNGLILIGLIIAGFIIHELIHGVTWVYFGRKPLSAVKFGLQWKTITPYAHLKEPIRINPYRIGAFMPGFILGILPYILSLVLGNSDLFWFSIIHTTAAGGDWLVLWLIRNVKSGMLVEDHPSRVGCYVLEGQ